MQKNAVAFLALTSAVSTAMGANSPTSSANADEVAELRSLVTDLQGQVDTLKSQNDENWLTEQRAGEIRGLVQDVLADADTRASLLQSGAMAGYDKNFFISSADGNYLLQVKGQMQFRFGYNYQDADTSSDNHRWGFENRRTKLIFSGHVFDPTWKYIVQGAFARDGGVVSGGVDGIGGFAPFGSSSGGTLGLEVAEITKDLENGLNIRFGQFKGPFMREELVSSSRQLAVERSLVNEEFNQDYQQGVEVNWKGDQFRAAAMFSDGFGSRNTAFLAEDTDYAFTGRVEFLGAGDWKQFDDLTSWRGEEFAMMVGAAGHIQEGESGTPNTELEVTSFTVDASLEFGGFNLFGAFVYRMLEADIPGAGEIDLDQYGFVVQGGFFFTDDWEGFARYEFGDADTGEEDLSVITAGVNKYWNKHSLKWTTDVGFGFDQVGSTFATSGAGYRADPENEDGQIVVRSQLQLLF